MAITNNKSKIVSGSTIERRHVDLLVVCIYTTMLLMLAILVLQLMGLFYPPLPQAEDQFGTAHPAFSWSPLTVSVFLLIPFILLTLVWIYLKQYFKRNAHGSHLVIPYLEKHPRKKVTKYLYYAFSAAMGFASVLLALVSFIQLGRHEGASLMTRAVALIPCISMGFGVFVFLLLTSLMRRRKRTYSHHRHVQRRAQEESVEETADSDQPQ